MKGLILLDVFSYSCMNCLRSLEFIKRIDKKYRRFGLKTIIIHPPEWNFEKNKRNVDSASKRYNIRFPIKIDKKYSIIKKFEIDFWPTQILMKDNKMVYKHIGEGSYKQLENKIKNELKIKSINAFKTEPKYSKFPTVYCGKKKKGKIKVLNNDNGIELKFGIAYLDSNWIQKNEYIQSTKNNSVLSIKTIGKIINFVAESLYKKPMKISIKLNNRQIKKLSINKPQLYQLIKSKNNKKSILTITASKNLAIYSFSFQ